MDDYSRMAKVIEYLDAHHTAQPSLAELADLLGLSESHFHRLFRRWAGVTPKDFLQCLTAGHARRQLEASSSVLDSALDAGLSGPGRLHDLMVTLEAATPGEVGRGGEGLNVNWGAVSSPFGWCSIGWTVRGVCHFSFHPDKPDAETPLDLFAAWPRANFATDTESAQQLVGRIFNPEARAGEPLRVWVRGSAFQVTVWRALLKIPPGEVVSYGQLASDIECPGAARAVGTACGANLIGFLIPCHRVIRGTGVVTGYRWGDTRKRAILAHEFGRKVVIES